jgi:hypothetical protein
VLVPRTCVTCIASYLGAVRAFSGLQPVATYLGMSAVPAVHARLDTFIDRIHCHRSLVIRVDCSCALTDFALLRACSLAAWAAGTIAFIAFGGSVSLAGRAVLHVE